MQKKHRIFIAINLPSDIKKYLAGFEQKFSELPARWTPEDNLHITLLFLGDLTDEELGEVCMAVKSSIMRHQAFDLNFDKVDYGPDEKLPPRMLWASGQKSKEMSVLKQDLESSLCDKVNLKPESKIFSPHVTLARISAFAWRQIEPEERPEVEQSIDLNFTVESIEVMESELGRSGPKYTVIESFPLNEFEI